ncbi:hypothetical protein BDZ45DRAFT_694465 [Acephala macrosclerotiorum]|nr:hypothetical protein BDZ45DRAFT_694465 [Acephala macrosclerotiorum]
MSSSLSSGSTGSPPSLSKKPTKPCPKCPHRLSDLASHDESPEADEISEPVEPAESNTVDVPTAPEETCKEGEVAEAYTAPPEPTTSTSTTTPIEVPALIREDAFMFEDSDSENDYWSKYQNGRKSVRFEIDLTSEEVAKRAAAAEEAGKRASGGARPRTILKNWGEVEKVEQWPLSPRSDSAASRPSARWAGHPFLGPMYSPPIEKKVRFTTVRFVADPEIYHNGDYDEEDLEEEGLEEDLDDRSSTLVEESERSDSKDREDSDEDKDSLEKAAENLHIDLPK